MGVYQIFAEELPVGFQIHTPPAICANKVCAAVKKGSAFAWLA